MFVYLSTWPLIDDAFIELGNLDNLFSDKLVLIDLQVFSQVSASLDTVELGINSQDTEEILNRMKNEVGVSFERTDQCFVISGSLSQINNCQFLLQTYLNKEENISDKLNKFSLEVDHQGFAETSPAQLSTGVIVATPVKEKPVAKVQYIGNLQREDGKGIKHPPIAEKQTFKVDTLAISFMKRFFQKQIQNIEENCSVECVTLSDGIQITLQPKPDCDQTKHIEACSDFLMLLESASQGMSTWELDSKGADEDSDVSLIQSLSTKYPVILERLQDNGRFVVYGDSASVEQVKLSVQGKLPEQVTGDDPTGTQEMEMAAQGSVSIETYNYRTENGVNVSLRYGDITSENADAIVNPANEFLCHAAGLAESIARLGGREIKKESEDLIAKRRNGALNVGDAVHTKAGNLPCKFVIHAVGPEWGKQSEKKAINLLQKACVESLKLASKLGLSSIALPAISSGVYRTPIDVCASAMLNGIQEYLEYLKKPDEPKKDDGKKKLPKVNGQNKGGEKKPAQKKEVRKTKEAPTEAAGNRKDQGKARLQDIRFVLIDADAMDVFEKEFIKRFGGDKTNTSDDDDESL